MSNFDEDKLHLNAEGTVEMPAKYTGMNKFKKYSYLQNIIEKETAEKLKKALAKMRDDLWKDPSFHSGTPSIPATTAPPDPTNPGGRPQRGEGGGKRRKKSKRRKSKRRNSKKRRSKKRRSKRIS